MKQTILNWAIVLVIAAIIYGCFYVDFHLWRMEHPTTPFWVYIVRSGK